MYKITEGIGENYAKLTYLKIENQKPQILLSIDGFTYEKDVNNENKLETISEYGSPGKQKNVYKWNFERKYIICIPK